MNRVLFALYTSLSTCIYACLIPLWRSECEFHYVVMLFTVGLHYNYYRVFLSLNGCLITAVFRGTRLISDNRIAKPTYAFWLARLLAYVTIVD